MMRGEKGVMSSWSSRSSRPEFHRSSGVPVLEFQSSLVLQFSLVNPRNNSIDTPLSPAFLEILANPKNILLRRRTSSKKETIFEFNQLS